MSPGSFIIVAIRRFAVIDSSRPPVLPPLLSFEKDALELDDELGSEESDRESSEPSFPGSSG